MVCVLCWQAAARCASQVCLPGRRVRLVCLCVAVTSFTCSYCSHARMRQSRREGKGDFQAMLAALRAGTYDALVLDSAVLEYTVSAAAGQRRQPRSALCFLAVALPLPAAAV